MVHEKTGSRSLPARSGARDCAFRNNPGASAGFL
jgi:hypothetical protein